jgi:hypothetical protein
MSNARKLGIVLAALVVGLVGLEVTSELAGSGSFSLVSTAQARVGRPLTPVSVAGVARRTTRRCAAGVYDC